MALQLNIPMLPNTDISPELATELLTLFATKVPEDDAAPLAVIRHTLSALTSSYLAQSQVIAHQSEALAMILPILGNLSQAQVANNDTLEVLVSRADATFAQLAEHGARLTAAGIALKTLSGDDVTEEELQRLTGEIKAAAVAKAELEQAEAATCEDCACAAAKIDPITAFTADGGSVTFEFPHGEAGVIYEQGLVGVVLPAVGEETEINELMQSIWEITEGLINLDLVDAENIALLQTVIHDAASGDFIETGVMLDLISFEHWEENFDNLLDQWFGHDRVGLFYVDPETKEYDVGDLLIAVLSRIVFNVYRAEYHAASKQRLAEALMNGLMKPAA